MIVQGADSETEPDEKKNKETGVVNMSLVHDGEQKMAESVSLVANALLESLAPPKAYNQLQVKSPAKPSPSCR